MSCQRNEELLDIRNVGENMHKKFCSELLKGDKAIWAHMKKKDPPTHTACKKITKMNLQERKLMILFLVLSRKRRELNLEKYLGQYELSVAPRSLFTSDSKLSLEKKKADVMHGIKEETKQANAS